MRKSKIRFKRENVEVIIEVEHWFSCTEEEIISIARDELKYMNDIDVMMYDEYLLNT